MATERPSQPHRVAVIGNYLPRQCGIATFTTDLCEALATGDPATTCFAVAVNDTESGYEYPQRVRFELAERDLSSYRQAADFLNINSVDLVCLQHEYGIFGGSAGSHILALLRELRMPLVTTLHTILREPDPNQRRVMEELAQLSDRLVVMSQRAATFLREIYRVADDKIDVIPHGIPDVPFVDPNFFKDQFGVEGKLVMLTFGLLSPNKGVEYVIQALPAILARYPNVVYMVLGATHPHVKRRQGESYRLGLERLAHDYGVEGNVIFHNRFVSLEELVEFIGAADLYVTPYLNAAQIVSGTLAYAVGAGKAVVSSPYWYAEEVLADGRGVLVPFADAAAIATRVQQLLDNEPERHAIRKRAYQLGREMTWAAVAQRYAETFCRAREHRAHHPRAAFVARTLAGRPAELPELDLKHVRRLTDDTGMLQHAIFTVPNYGEGYTTDDNARALLMTALLEEIGHDADETSRLASRYLAFLWHAFDPQTSRFHNVLSFDRRWLDDIGSEDSHGRALWALGAVVAHSNHRGLRGLAGHLFALGLPATESCTSPRAWAFLLLAVRDYLSCLPGDRAAQQVRCMMGERLMDLYRANSSTDWPWFEDILSYDNATLPYALLTCGTYLRRCDMTEAALRSLSWLVQTQRAAEGHFVPIGSEGFYPRGGQRARFDQQPIEAHATVAASLEAHRMTGDPRWRTEARRAFEWFLGRNDLRLSLYDSSTGGCRDGLHPNRANENQGAESTLAFLLSLLEIQLSESLFRRPEGQIRNDGQSTRSALSPLPTQPDPDGGGLALPR
jgi:glycosyltransferase involved in cell wall biosynthesis